MIKKEAKRIQEITNKQLGLELVIRCPLRRSPNMNQQQLGEIPIRVLVKNLSQVRLQIIPTFNTSILEQALVNQTNQHRVYLLPSVVKNAGKHLAHVRN
jgi:hypothetical protein